MTFTFVIPGEHGEAVRDPGPIVTWPDGSRLSALLKQRLAGMTILLVTKTAHGPRPANVRFAPEAVRYDV